VSLFRRKSSRGSVETCVDDEAVAWDALLFRAGHEFVSKSPSTSRSIFTYLILKRIDRITVLGAGVNRHGITLIIDY
jgi:hypothetical protein